MLNTRIHTCASNSRFPHISLFLLTLLFLLRVNCLHGFEFEEVQQRQGLRDRDRGISTDRGLVI